MTTVNLINSTGDRYAQAYRTYIYTLDQENDTYAARSSFMDIADTPNNVRNVASEQCRKYIDVARILAIDDYNAPKNQALQNSYRPSSSMVTQKQVDQSSISIYPNPVDTELVLNSVTPINELALVNAVGQVVYTASTNERQFRIDVSKLPKGLYTLLVTNTDQVSMKYKVIIQ